MCRFKLFFLLFLFLSSIGLCEERLKTPLEQSNYQHLSFSEQRFNFLNKLTSKNYSETKGRLAVIGKSAGNRSIESILIKKKHYGTEKAKIKVMLIGAQHGSEPSGGEALLIIASQLLSSNSSLTLLDTMEFFIVPISNPDGFENRRRVNSNGTNLSTDYGTLVAPESSAINKAMMDYQPHIVLDVHESALLKKKTLAAEGWLTDFEAQFEYANNPNVNSELRKLTADILLPTILKRVNFKNLKANRYFGEITRTKQVITHGGLSARNLRNKAGLLGAVSFLLENRLDPSTGSYETPRNIKERVRKQLLSIHEFLKVCQENATIIESTVSMARRHDVNVTQVWLNPQYKAEPSNMTIKIPLKKRNDKQLIEHTFIYHGVIDAGPASSIPAFYNIADSEKVIEKWLKKQGAKFEKNELTGDIRIDSIQNFSASILPLYLEKESTSTILN